MDYDSIKLMVEEFFNGQYEVMKFLGEGSFAKVYLVKHTFLDDLRAMKIIKEPIKRITNTKAVFEEVRIATRLRNQNIINIYDAGIISDNEDLAYFVMEYVPGGDLQDYLQSFIKTDIRMPVSRALDIMKQILTGLNTLHSSNPPIVHRDLKLNNILLNYSADGEIEIKISDFGFAKEVTTTKSDIDIVGTRPYMAPECYKKTVSTMTDIYAVGVIFYELLTGHYPYDVDKFSLDELLDLKPWKNELIPPSKYNEAISDKFDKLVLKCLEVNPDDRYQDAGEVLLDVELLIEEIKSNHTVGNNDSQTIDDYSNYIINDSILKAFELAKTENGLNEAIYILEKEILKDYHIRQCYGETLMMWKSEMPDVKLISKAFTVNLNGKNYSLSGDLLREAFAYNPALKDKYYDYIRLWNIFTQLTKDNNLIKAVLGLEELMGSSSRINEIYKNIIIILKTFSIEDIVAEAVRLADMNYLVDASNLLEFAVVGNIRARNDYEYELSMWKQNMYLYYPNSKCIKENAIDYAIDLGTTDSIISYYNNGKPVIIKNHNTGEVFTPSAVLVKDDEILVGDVARKALISRDDNAVSEFKHNMGFPIPFKGKSFKSFLPEELSAEVLKDLRLSVYKQCGRDIDQAVICVPASSNPMKTKAVMDAARLAGFKSYNLILEPVAVAMAYDFAASNDDLWMIYDLGGATFDATLMRNDGGAIEKVASVTLDNVGGNVFDWKIVDDVLAPQIINDLHLADFDRENPKYWNAFSKLKNACEDAKIKLSKSDDADILIPNLFNGYDFTYNLNKIEFAEIIMPMLEGTFNACNFLLNDNSWALEDIDRIILVGGSCLSPTIQEIIEDEFKKPLEFGLNPLTVVAKGAAIYAGSLEKSAADSQIGQVALTLEKNEDILTGRIFTDDENHLFLGYYIEFNDFKIPMSIDGTFKITLTDDEYEINVYHEDELIKIDDKSPNSIKQDQIFIPYLEKSYSMSFKEDSVKYKELMEDIERLTDYIEFDEDALGYLKRLNDIQSSQTGIYLNHFSKQAIEAKRQLDYEILLENVKTKASMLNKDIEWSEISDYNQLKRIHENLIGEYFKENKNSVIEEAFHNLRYEGIYTKNQELYEDLVKEAMMMLNTHDYGGLSKMVIRLYEIDERSF